MKINITMIAAVSDNGVIGMLNHDDDGRRTRLPWKKIPEDMARFKELTAEYPVIVGRRTFQEIGLLKDRPNIVLSKHEFFDCKKPPDFICHSPLDALACAMDTGSRKVFIIGGGDVYGQFMSVADRIELTIVHGNYEGNTFFPDIPYNKWKETRRKCYSPFRNWKYIEPDFSFVTLARK